MFCVLRRLTSQTRRQGRDARSRLRVELCGQSGSAMAQPHQNDVEPLSQSRVSGDSSLGTYEAQCAEVRV